MRWILNGVYLLALVATLPFWIYKSLSAGKYRTGLWRKLTGRGVDAVVLDGRPVLWLHAVSVGEVLLLKPLLSRMAVKHPDLQPVLSTTTETGFAVAVQTYPTLQVFFAPMDFSWALERAFNVLQPAALVLTELELWPNQLLTARRRQTPVAVVNARMSERSFRGYRRFRRILSPALQSIQWWGAQTEVYAKRIQELLGELVINDEARSVEFKREQRQESPAVVVTGSMKYEGAPTDRSNAKTCELRRLFGLKPNERVWVAGSTQGPEDEIVLDAFAQLVPKRPDLRLILAPRHKERFDEAARLIAARGLRFVRRSQLSTALPSSAPVTLCDSIGELAAVWGLANFGFVGGSLDGARGGQSMIEPAGYGVAVCFGPHVWNFRDTVDKLLASGGAVQLGSGAELAPMIARWLADPTAAAAVGFRAREFILSQQGAVDATLTAICRLAVRPGVLRRSA